MGSSFVKMIFREWGEEDYNWVMKLFGVGYGLLVVVGD